LQAQIEVVTALPHQDLAAGCGEVYIPEARARQYPKAARETGWQWVFPARARALDPRSGREMRHHVLESGRQKAVKRAAEQAGFDKKVGCQTLPHSRATHRLEHGVNIRGLLALLGHADVKTTERYPHVMARDIRPLQSPLDQLSPDGSYQGVAGKFRKTDQACLDLLEFPLPCIDCSPFLGTRVGGSDQPA
jgi:Phage integrase family